MEVKSELDQPLRILLAASEVFPLIKTGGLADAVAGLATALDQLGHEVRIALPAYAGLLEQMDTTHRIGSIAVHGRSFDLYEGRVAGLPPLWLFANAALFERGKNPYQDESGQTYADNAERFGSYCAAVAQACAGIAGEDFRPQVVHANDWQAGLILPWLRRMDVPAARIFTIHNLAYQGVFPAAAMEALRLPSDWWQMDGVEFYHQLSFMKAGIVYAQRITTVSPTYAGEILTPAFGQDLDGLLRSRRETLSGIVNGIDEVTWNPRSDPHLPRCYDADDVCAGKIVNRRALQQRLSLDIDEAPLLIGIVTRLAWQKGMDVLAAAMSELMQLPLQIALLGDGDHALAESFTSLAAQWRGRFAFHNAYDEGLAHLIEAGADSFLMPSRYEPCGLNQIYSQRYGTIPIVRRTGGLADTVIDATGETLAQGTATGIHILHTDIGGLLYGVRRAIGLRTDPSAWLELQRAGMAADYSWRNATQRYVSVYHAGLD